MIWRWHLQALALAMLVTPARLSAQVISTSPNYLPGQKFTLMLEMKAEDARDTRLSHKYQLSITVRVLRKSTEGTYLEWVAGKTSVQGIPETGVRILEMADKIFENLRLIVHLDPAGRLQGIQNEAELKARIQEFVLLLVPQAIAKIPDPAERQRAADSMLKVMTPEGLLSGARQEIDLFFGISGLQLEAGKPLRVKSSRWNPFGTTGTLDSEIEIIPATANSETGEVRIEFRQQLDPNLAAGFLPPNMSQADSGEFVLDTASGRVKQVRHVRTLRQEGAPLRVETTEITVQ